MNAALAIAGRVSSRPLLHDCDNAELASISRSVLLLPFSRELHHQAKPANVLEASPVRGGRLEVAAQLLVNTARRASALHSNQRRRGARGAPCRRWRGITEEGLSLGHFYIDAGSILGAGRRHNRTRAAGVNGSISVAARASLPDSRQRVLRASQPRSRANQLGTRSRANLGSRSRANPSVDRSGIRRSSEACSRSSRTYAVRRSRNSEYEVRRNCNPRILTAITPSKRCGRCAFKGNERSCDRQGDSNRS